MSALVSRRVRTRQPQQVTQADPRWIARGLKFAVLPSVGFVNLADGSAPLQTSGAMTVSATSNGIAHAGARAEFAGVSAAAGLTIISIWRSRASSDYLGADGTPVLVSTRTAINTGWSYGRGVAIGGASNGNLIPQSMTFQGVAQYTEANWTIESRIDTPVACRYDPIAGKISWFRFGQKSSADTSVSAPSAGGNLVFGAQGDFASNGQPWLDRDTVCLVFDQALSDAEIAELSANPWQAFKAQTSRRWLASSAPAGSTDSGSLGSTLGGIGLSASGTAKISGTASVVLGALATTSAGAASDTGALACPLAALSLNASGSVSAAGVLTMTMAPLVAAGAGTTPEAGALSGTLSDLALIAYGTTPANGAFASALGSVAPIGAGGISVVGLSASMLGGLFLTAAGTVANQQGGLAGDQQTAGQTIAGSMAAQLGAINLAAIGNAPISGLVGVTLGSLQATAAGAAQDGGQTGVTLGVLALTAYGGLPVAADLNAALGALTLTATAGMFVFIRSPQRTYHIAPENRRYRIAPENRTYRIEP